MTGFRSFDNCTGERVLNQLEAGNLSHVSCLIDDVLSTAHLSALTYRLADSGNSCHGNIHVIRAVTVQSD